MASKKSIAALRRYREKKSGLYFKSKLDLLESRYVEHKTNTDEFGNVIKFERKRWKNKIKAIHEATGEKISSIIANLLSQSSFNTSEQIFMNAIKVSLNNDIAARNKLRKLISVNTGTKYKETTMQWDKFRYDSTLKAAVNEEAKIVISIMTGADSTQPDFLEIRSLA